MTHLLQSSKKDYFIKKFLIKLYLCYVYLFRLKLYLKIIQWTMMYKNYIANPSIH